LLRRTLVLLEEKQQSKGQQAMSFLIVHRSLFIAHFFLNVQVSDTTNDAIYAKLVK